jgi:hypothetical protein
MTQEQKELLLKDLCGRLAYSVQIEIEGYRSGVLKGIDGDTISTDMGINYPLRLVKPYLRPISSMTIEEECEFCRLFGCDSVNVTYGYMNWEVGGSCDNYDFDIEFSKLANAIDYLNAHHFDYRGLIPMGLALPAPEGMYK